MLLTLVEVSCMEVALWLQFVAVVDRQATFTVTSQLLHSDHPKYHYPIEVGST